MARRAEGWKLVKRGDIWRVRFTYQDRRYEITTGERDSRKAEVIAAQIYADVVSGRVSRANNGALIHPTTPLDELCADWIAAIEPELGRDTGSTYTVYSGHWSAFFGSIGSVNTGNVSNYSRERLKKVVRETVIKELSALRRFLLWCFEQGHVREVPLVRPPSKKATGKRHPQGRRAPMPITPAQVSAIVSKLPAQSRTRKGKSWPIRDRFEFAYETGLRPECIDGLEERDLTAFGLHIRPELDKNRWERTIPLSDRALEILTASVTGTPSRRFFGEHDRRESWRKAAIAALGAGDGKRVNPYDLKHARVSQWRREGKNPLGIKFLTGVDEALEEYLHPTRTDAEQVLWGVSGAPTGAGECEGRDLNPHGSYPTSTSSESGSVAAPESADKKPAAGQSSSAPSGVKKCGSEAAPQYRPEHLAAAYRAVMASSALAARRPA